MNTKTLAVVAGTLLLLVLAGGALLARSGDDAAHEARIATLEAQTSVLQERLAKLEGRRGRPDSPRGERAGAGPRPGRTDEDAPWRGARGVRQADGDLAAALDEGADPEVREKVQSLVREELEAADEERWEKRRQRRAERIEQSLGEFAAARSLPAADQERLTVLWSDEREQLSEVFRKAREDMSWNKAREEADRIREETDESARAVLGEQDYAAWIQLREDESPRPR